MFSTPLGTLKVQYLFLVFVGTPLSYLFNLHWNADEPYRKNVINTNEAFDFIVVGGGSAGLVVANRLSEHYRTLLIEAGGRPFPLTQAPGLGVSLLNHPDVDWSDRSVPQEYASHAMENNSTVLNHGKGLGGSSMLNYMQYMRGSPEDFNEWARVSKDPAWKYDNLLKYFRKLENYRGRNPQGKVHGKHGPMIVEKSIYDPLAYEWEAGFEELGYKYLDPNGYQEEGYFPVETNIVNGSRHSTYTAYIKPILKRKNLKIELYAHVTKVELDKNNRAVGVHYVKDGKDRYVKALKEIILSAGSLGSPKILMLSGIGPADHLKSLGIPVKVDLPVGKNLQDHILTYVGPFIINAGNTGSNSTTDTFRDYLFRNMGPFATFGAIGSTVAESSLAPKGWPDIFLVGASWKLHDTIVEDFNRVYGYRKEVLSGYFKNHYGNDSFTILATLGRPKGRGELRLASKDPFEPPIIDPKYLSHPDDRRVILEAVKISLKLGLETEAFRKIGSHLIPNLLPGCEQYGSTDSDEYWECYVKHWTNTMWHFCSTCKMGSGPKDKDSVVDSKLRVLGTKGLRVMDNSIMPQVTNANTHFPALVIGERGAAFVLKHWKEVK